MKTLRWIAIAASFIFLPALSYPAPFGYLRISLIEGDVQILTEDTGDWVPASLNMPLNDGDRIWVPEGGRTELQLRDGTALRLDEKTSLDVLTLEKDSYQFYLPEGRIYANFKGARGVLLQIDTPMSSIRAYERSIFRVDILNDYQTDISVYQGFVYVEGQNGRIRVDQGKRLALREGYPEDLSSIGPPDEWERWNRDRNRIYADRQATSRYLPEELHPYASEFEDHGRWVYVRGYGYVWTPTVVVSSGWAPYRIGRWVWIRGDYVWVSYEPWGWVPYHYGRWAFVPAYGWCWVPPPRGAVYWGPGFVGWIRTPTYISWVPLAPREIYYGYGYYGPYSVNITRINISTINIERVVYRNARVRDGVTIVHHDTFVHGRHVEVNVRENPFLREKIHIGRPDIKPEKTTAMPVIREIPHTKRPPQKITEIKVREIRERRPLTREWEPSVLKPELPSRETTIMPKEVKPQERGTVRIEKRPAEKILPKEHKPSEREIEKPAGQKPAGKVEKTTETKPAEKGKEATQGLTSPPLRPEKQLEPKPKEKTIGRTLSPGVEPPREDRKSIDPERGRSIEKESPVQRSAPVREKEIKRSPEQRAPEREHPIQREGKPEQDMERQRERKHSGKEDRH